MNFDVSRQAEGPVRHQPRGSQRHPEVSINYQLHAPEEWASTRAICSISPSRLEGKNHDVSSSPMPSPTIVHDSADESALGDLMPMPV